MTRPDIAFSPAYAAAAHAGDTASKSGAVADALRRDGRSPSDPSAWTERAHELIARVHHADYVAAVETGSPTALAESQGFPWDPGIPAMAVAHAAGLVASVASVLGTDARIGGSLSSGLHHARAGRGGGHCTFNGLAVAAEEAFDRGAERILVLDFDARSGGGTRSMTRPDDVVQIDVSLVDYDRWSPVGFDALLATDRRDYLEAVSEALDLADVAGAFDLVLYSAGVDPADTGVPVAHLARRERMVADWALGRGRKLVYALGSGATGPGTGMDDLVARHRLTIDAFDAASG